MITLPEAAIFDMDGTLVNVSSIRHYVTGWPRRHDLFHAASIDCPPHEWVVQAAREQHALGRAVLIVTAREWQWRNISAWWLAIHGVPSDGLWMRADRDYRKDFVVKREMLAKIRRYYTPVLAHDDNPDVLALWESEGIETVTVPGWDYHRATALGKE